jgi:glucosylceramidase
MGWKEQLTFVKEALGPALRKANLDVKVYAFDHNYNYDDMPDQQQYPLHIYADAEAARFFAGAAYHNYGGKPEELLRIYHEAPDKELVFSEASIGTWNNGRDLEKSLLRDVEQLGLATVNGWCRGAVVWNLMLDNDRGPHRGEGACATCYGVVDIDNTDYTTITRNSHFYAMAHMSVVAKPGAYRIESDGDAGDSVTYAAFVNPDGSYGLVVSNRGESKQMNIQIAGKPAFVANLPANGVVSYLISF